MNMCIHTHIPRTEATMSGHFAHSLIHRFFQWLLSECPLCVWLCAGGREDTQRIKKNLATCLGEPRVWWAQAIFAMTKLCCPQGLAESQLESHSPGFTLGLQSSLLLEQREARWWAAQALPTARPPAPLGLGQLLDRHVLPAGSPRPHKPLPFTHHHSEAARGW